MFDMFLIADEFEDSASVWESLDECKTECAEYIINDGFDSHIIITAKAVKEEKVSFVDRDADLILMRFEGGETLLLHPSRYFHFDDLKKEVAYQWVMSVDDDVACEVFCLYEVKRYVPKLTVEFAEE